MYGVPNRIEIIILNRYIRQKEAQQRRFFEYSYNPRKAKAARERMNRQYRRTSLYPVENLIFSLGGSIPNFK